MDSFFGIGIGELVFIAIIALVVLGPERLPGAMREVLKFVRQVRNLTSDLTSQFSEEMKALDDLNPQKILRELTDEVDDKKAAGTSTPAKPAAAAAAKPAVKPPAPKPTPKPTTTAKPTTVATAKPAANTPAVASGGGAKSVAAANPAPADDVKPAELPAGEAAAPAPEPSILPPPPEPSAATDLNGSVSEAAPVASVKQSAGEGDA